MVEKLKLVQNSKFESNFKFLETVYYDYSAVHVRKVVARAVIINLTRNYKITLMSHT